MHYQHRYHAGNFADVFKHILLCGLLEAMNRKPAPWCYLETHAGAGAYDLEDDAAQRTAEWRDGIGRLWQAAAEAALPESFLRTVRAHNDGSQLRHYPGSPQFALGLARADDRLLLCERQAPIAAQLRERVAADPRAAVHVRDGYEAHALLPPLQKRGLILVDPPFERPDEFDAVTTFLERALARFGHGVYAVWHPVKNRYVAERWSRRLGQQLARPLLRVTFDTGAPDEGQMHACGLVVVNPPFGFDQAAAPWLAQMVRTLGQGKRAASTCESG